MNKPYFYLIGDIMSEGSQYEMLQIEKILDKYNIDYYSARKNSSINDKAKADNSNLAERIFKADFEELEKATHIVYNMNQNAIGSTVEIGAIAAYNRIAEKNGLNSKKVYVLCTDIRRQNEKIEIGDRRSFSVNALLYGVILYLTQGKGIISKEDFEMELDIRKKIISKLHAEGITTQDKDKALLVLSKCVNFKYLIKFYLDNILEPK